MEIVFVPFDEIKESQNRLLAILEIEHDVNLIKEMFIELNSMIEEQSIPIQTIVVQIEEAKESSKVANDHVEKSNEYMQGYNSKITKIIMISISSIIFIKLLTSII
jgi:t-SNARE complex subunit (syntaxin)